MTHNSNCKAFPVLQYFFEKLLNNEKGHRFLKNVNVEIHYKNTVFNVEIKDCEMYKSNVDDFCSCVMYFSDENHVLIDSKQQTLTVARAVEKTQEVSNLASFFFCLYICLRLLY